MRRLLFGGGHTGSLASIEILSRSRRFAFGATEKNWIHDPRWRRLFPRARDTIAKYHPAPLFPAEAACPPWREGRPNRDLSADLARSLHEPFNLLCEVLDLVLHV